MAKTYIEKPQITGALFDFGAWLTSREGSVTLGAKHNAAIVADLIAEFCELRGVGIENADVKNWNSTTKD